MWWWARRTGCRRSTEGLGSLLRWAWSKAGVAENSYARLCLDLCRISPSLLQGLSLASCRQFLLVLLRGSWHNATLPVSTVIVPRRSNQRKIFTFVSCSVPSSRVKRQQGNGDPKDLPLSTSITAWRAESAVVHFKMEIIFSHGGEHVPSAPTPPVHPCVGDQKKTLPKALMVGSPVE